MIAPGPCLLAFFAHRSHVLSGKNVPDNCKFINVCLRQSASNIAAGQQKKAAAFF
jgi:hypothetical protein